MLTFNAIQIFCFHGKEPRTTFPGEDAWVILRSRDILACDVFCGILWCFVVLLNFGGLRGYWDFEKYED